MHSIGIAEPEDLYVSEELKAPRFQESLAREFGTSAPNGAMRRNAVAGILHLEHLARLTRKAEGQPALKRHCRALSRALNLHPENIRSKVERLLSRHAFEWNEYLGSLGPDSFVNRWIGHA